MVSDPRLQHPALPFFTVCLLCLPLAKYCVGGLEHFRPVWHINSTQITPDLRPMTNFHVESAPWMLRFLLYLTAMTVGEKGRMGTRRNKQRLHYEMVDFCGCCCSCWGRSCGQASIWQFCLCCKPKRNHALYSAVFKEHIGLAIKIKSLYKKNI